MVTNNLQFITPFSTFGDDEISSDPLAQEVVRYMKEDSLTTVPWNFTTFPSQTFKDDYGASLLEYANGNKKWDAVVTYNPDGVTGHIHHKKTFQHVYKVCDKYKMLDRLYYFGHFYKKGEVPNTLIRMSDEDLAIKMEEIKLYSSVRNNIHNYWEQMLPYENWIPALKWNEYPR